MMLLLALMLGGQAGQVVPAGDVVAGTVLSERDQRPIVHATVVLFDEASEQTVVSTYSDASGHYQLPAVPAGRYSLSASAAGYITGSYLHHEGYFTALVLGAGLPTSDLTLTLMPQATLAGTVTDDRDPIVLAKMELFREAPGGGIESVNTSPAPQGVFEFTGLAPGRYYLCATSKPWYSVLGREDGAGDGARYRVSIDPALLVLYPPVYYPDALDSSDARPIDIHPGEQVNVHLRMHPEHTVRFVVRLPESAPAAAPVKGDEEGGPPPGPQVMLSRMVFGKEVVVPVGFEERDGALVASDLLPGRYLVSRATADDGPPLRAGTVELSDASTTLSLPEADAGASVEVTVRGFQKSGDSANALVVLHDLKNAAGDGSSPGVNLDDRNEAVFAGVAPSDYRLSVAEMSADQQPDLHLDTVSVDGGVAPDKLLHVTGKGRLAVVLSVTQTRVKVEGVAKHEGKPAPGAMIVLVPVGPDAHAGMYRRDQSDLDGSFNLLDAEPGGYILVAIEDGWSLRWDDAATLAPYLARGVAVTIPATAKGEFRVAAAVETVGR